MRAWGGVISCCDGIASCRTRKRSSTAAWAPRARDGTVSRAGGSCALEGLSVCGGAGADGGAEHGGRRGASRCRVGCPGGAAAGGPLLKLGSVGSVGGSEAAAGERSRSLYC